MLKSQQRFNMSTCNDSVVDVNVSLVLESNNGREIFSNYTIKIGVKSELRSNLSFLTKSTGEKIDSCHKAVDETLSKLNHNHNFALSFATNMSVISDALPKIHTNDGKKCTDDLLQCPSGSEETNKRCGK